MDQWQMVAGKGDAARLEEMWLERLEHGFGDGEELLEALRYLRGANKKAMAGTLLELAVEEAAGQGAWSACRAFAREMLRQAAGDDKLARRKLVDAMRHLGSGKPSLARFLKHFDLPAARKPLESLDQLETWLAHDVGEVFAMAGRGPGRVVEANPALGMLRLDLEQEKRVPMPIDAAAKYLTPLPEGHFLRRRLEDRAGLRELVMADPQMAMVMILESFGTAMSAPEIKAALTGLLTDQEWTSWWTKARKLPRLLAEGSGVRVLYRLAAGDAADGEIRAQFEAAELPGRVELARRHGGRSRELAELMGRELAEASAKPDADPSLAWDGLQLALRLGGADREMVDAARAALVKRVGVVPLLEALGDAVQREQALDLALQVDPEGWSAALPVWLEQESHARVLGRLGTWLVERGDAALVQRFLDQAFMQPQRYPGVFVWACELTEDPLLGQLVEDRLGGTLLVRMVEFSERKEMVPYRARMRELLSAKGVAARLIAEHLTQDQARRLVQVLEAPGELWEVRSWVRRAVLARYPDLLKPPPSEAIPALIATAERLQEELRRLREKDIPEVLRAIQIAKEEGDLRENFEYHAARARQELLSARAAKLQEDLSRLRIIDPATTDCSVVRVGTRVALRRPTGPEQMEITILGPYEADPERSILSSGSEAAEAVLDKDRGTAVTFGGETWIIADIVPAV